ncbi:MAG TPA: alanine--glyoxylate aminotransferase family protein [Thermoplasmata archaeon]|nr:alanine--glyoxylate aminotransferase family protein [Thermoplasmata archaeon]
MAFDVEDNVFMIPGPVKIHPRVLRAMCKPSMGHRSPEFKAVNKEIRELTQYLFQTNYDVAVLTGSGTAAMDAGINNLVHPGDRIVSMFNGKFGERLADIADVYSKNVTRIEAPWGRLEDLERLKKELEKGDVKLVTLVHNETSSGFCHPIEKIAKIVKKHDALLLADCITSAACLEVKPDEWGIDVTIAGSQKGIAAPAGLSMLAISPRALEAMHNESSYYLDLKKHVKKFKSDDTPYTPAIHLFLAYREALRILKEEGIENRISRVENIANACRSAIKAIGLELLAQDPYHSNTVTAIKKPDGVEIKELRSQLKNLGVVVAGAQAPHKGEFFRIGHMGQVDIKELASTITALEVCLGKLGYKLDNGAGVAAIERFM